jgi:hypothetical protein
MELPVPDPDPAAVERMKFEAANHAEPSRFHKLTDFMRRNPDVSDAAKAGAPTMDPPKREIPDSVPKTADASAPGFTGDVTVAPVNGPSALDTQPDARPLPPPAKPGDPAAPAAAPDSKKKSQ